jgi:hypothetical protein
MSSLRGQSNATGGGDIPVLVDAATQALLVKNVNDTTQASEIGGLTETAPATDTASSGLNGRLQRIAQRLTSLIALLPTSLGTKTAANSLPVTLASDGVASTTLGAIADAAATDSTSSWSMIALLKAIYAKLVTPSSAGHSFTVTITRPATTPTYAIGQVIGDTNGSAIFAFTNMGKAGGEVMITSIELEVDVASVPSGMTSYNVRLYNASPTAAADAAAWDIVSGDRGKYLGKVVISAPVDEGSTLFCDNDSINKQITLVSSTLYVELQTPTSYIATSGAVKRLTIHTVEV